MPRRVFYSFNYDNDCWRTQQVRNIGFIEGNRPVSSNDWEAVKKGGDKAIENWIADQLEGRSCTVVLVGSETANRRWVQHEIVQSWNSRKGVVGIRIHSLKDSSGNQSNAGDNPFDRITIGDKKLSAFVRLYRPTSTVSTAAYAAITEGISCWIEEAIRIRDNYGSNG
jgi:antiphage defense system Thoeris ThsB-like protein